MGAGRTSRQRRKGGRLGATVIGWLPLPYGKGGFVEKRKRKHAEAGGVAQNEEGKLGECAIENVCKTVTAGRPPRARRPESRPLIARK